MSVVSLFDPWKNPLCTCPKKYSLNPYTGCQHACLYCYITSYIPRAFECREKKLLLKTLQLQLPKLERLPVSMSNSSDPYPPIEEELKLTRRCLFLLSELDFPVQIITKSNLVVRDLDLLEKMRAVVSFTITTFNPSLSKRLEPNAPPPHKRLEAVKILSKKLPVTVRLDPVFPFLNDEEIERIVKCSAEAGAVHITASTFKPRPDSWQRMTVAFPDFCRKTQELYFVRGERRGKSRYLPFELRKELMLRVREACKEAGISFATCREGMRELNTSRSCDGTHLLD